VQRGEATCHKAQCHRIEKRHQRGDKREMNQAGSADECRHSWTIRILPREQHHGFMDRDVSVIQWKSCRVLAKGQENVCQRAYSEQANVEPGARNHTGESKKQPIRRD
jgi:hypothetical protein